MASPDLIGRQACHALRVIKQPWRKYSRHVEFESSFQSATLMRLHAAFTFTQPVKTGQPQKDHRGQTSSAIVTTKIWELKFPASNLCAKKGPAYAGPRQEKRTLLFVVIHRIGFSSANVAAGTILLAI